MQALLFDALVLGGLAALLGLVLGDVLSLLVFRSNPGYLSFAFPVGSQRIVTWQSIAIAVGAGLLAACIGVLTPLWEIFSRPATASSIWQASHSPAGWRIGALAGGLSCLAMTTIILLAAPQSAVLGSVILVLALLLLLPLLLDAIVAVLRSLATPFESASTRIAVVELRSRKTRARSIAIAATGAIAVFGSVTIQGARANLQRGLDRLAHDVSRGLPICGSSRRARKTCSRRPRFARALVALAHLARCSGRRSVPCRFPGLRRSSHLGLRASGHALRTRSRRASSSRGDLALATTRLRAGGWAVLSQALAERSTTCTSASPSRCPRHGPTVFRVAALTTNLGWPPGAIILSSGDYARAWGSTDPSAYNVMLAPGAHPETVRHEIQRALGPRSGLTVETARQREQSQRAASRQGVSRLTQIATLVLIATVLAMSVAMGDDDLAAPAAARAHEGAGI